MDNIKGTALITGAGRGIGLELCKWFGEQGIHTIGVSRNVSALKNLINVHNHHEKKSAVTGFGSFRNLLLMEKMNINQSLLISSTV